MNATASSIAEGNSLDVGYQGFLARLNARLRENTFDGTRPLFTTNAAGLFAAYLHSFPEGAVRQHHNCSACRHFIEHFGGLVTVDDFGQTTPALWHLDDATPELGPAIGAMAQIVREAKVTGVFLSALKMWGSPITGIWRHMAVMPRAPFLRLTQTAGQAMAEKREDLKNVVRALGDYTLPTVEVALKLLSSESLYRSEKVLGQAQWLYELHRARDSVRGSAKGNVIWRAIAMAPAGFCHPRSSMIGTLLDDIAAGKDFRAVSRSFAAKMNPVLYQRPQAPPAAGNIALAEKLVEKLGVRASLERRFARVEEIQALWRPRETAPPAGALPGGVFSHLKPKDAAPATSAIEIPPQTMTWDKFLRTVLPSAEQIDFVVPYHPSNYCAIVTATNADAPPILQWDLPDKRNPFSSYVYNHGSSAAQWGLTPGSHTRVTAITLKPPKWSGSFEHFGDGVIFILDGATDSRDDCGNAIFPENLKSEFHAIRATVEAYARSAKLGGAEDASANGILLQKGIDWQSALFRVTSCGAQMHYKLDRWD